MAHCKRQFVHISCISTQLGLDLIKKKRTILPAAAFSAESANETKEKSQSQKLILVGAIERKQKYAIHDAVLFFSLFLWGISPIDG